MNHKRGNEHRTIPYDIMGCSARDFVFLRVMEEMKRENIIEELETHGLEHKHAVYLVRMYTAQFNAIARKVTDT